MNLDIASLITDDTHSVVYHRRSGLCDRVTDPSKILERKKTYALMAKLQKKLTAPERLAFAEARFARWVADCHADCTGRRKDKSKCECECHDASEPPTNGTDAGGSPS